LKILVVDDHALVREGLRQVLKGLDDSLEVLEAGVCSRAFALAQTHPDLDLVLLDFHLPDMNGLQALEVFSKDHPELPIIMLSGSVNPSMMHLVMKKGAAAFLTKSGNSEELLSVARIVLSGGIYIPPALAAQAIDFSSNSAFGELNTPNLTSRQEDVLRLLMDGYANREIGQKLHLSEETVKNHVTGILRNFGVQNRTQAVLAARRFGYGKSLPAG
jgi:DNA-binding NarL/FixJ family response regulator